MVRASCGNGYTKAARNAVKDMHGVESDNNCKKDEERRAACFSSERIAAGVLSVPSEKFYLVLWDENSLENMTRQLGGVLDCLVALCTPNER